MNENINITQQQIAEALEKQTPKPVRVEHYPYKQKMYYCPVCDLRQMGTRKNIENGCYCKQCGQRLMWEELQ